MITLSAANQANIIKRHQKPATLVKMSGLSLQWSDLDVDGYEGGLMSVSKISTSYDPYVGLSHWSDVEIRIAADRVEQVMVSNELTNETLEVSLKYGSDAEIPRWKGVVDRWSFSPPDGILTIYGITQSDIRGRSLPLQQINSTNYTTQTIPDRSVNQWVPFTLGSPYRPRGILLNYGNASPIEIIFNAAVSGHAAIGAVDSTEFYVWAEQPGMWLEGRPSQATKTASKLTAGILDLVPNARVMCAAKLNAIDAEWEGGGSGSDPENAVNQDTSDYALLDNPAANATTAGNVLRCTLPDFSLPEGFTSNGIFFYGKIEKENALNHGARTAEKFHMGIETTTGTDPTSGQQKALISGSDTDFNNVDGADGLADVGFTMPNYSSVWDDDDYGSEGYFPANKISGRVLQFECIEEDIVAGGVDESEYFRIYWAGLYVICSFPFDIQKIFGGLSGYDDDGSGTYTGSANSLIETPSDVVYFILAELWGNTSWNTSSVSTARTAYGSYILGGQLFQLTDAEEALKQIVFQSRMRLWTDVSGQWKLKMWEYPGASPDKTFNVYDFYSDDEDIIEITQSPNENIYNQFDILYGWNEAEQKFNSTLSLDENTSGARGTWLTNSQSNLNTTRKMRFEARWITDDDTATSFGNWLIYMYADRHRVVTFATGFSGLEIELGDLVKLNHSDMTDTDESGGGDHMYEIISIETDLDMGKITFVGFQADPSESQLSGDQP